MYRYSKYIIRQLSHSTLLTAVSLTSIVWLTQALRLMDFIVAQGVGLDMFLLLTLLVLPSLLTMVLPVALFCAVLFVYQKLKSDSELVIMEAAGLSLWRLSRPALIVAAAVTLIGYAVSFYVMPAAYAKFREMQTFLRNNYVSVLLEEGVFNVPVDGLTVYVRRRDSGGRFHGILVHDNREAEMSITMMAEEGQLVSTPQGQRFLLTNGNRQEVRQGRLSLLYFDSYTLDLSFYTQGTGQRQRDPREMSAAELLQREGLADAEIMRRQGELHQRLLWPALALTMTLVGLGVLLPGEFNRRGNARRVVLAVLLVALIAFAAIGLRNLMGRHMLYLAAAYANALIPALIGAYVLSDRASRTTEGAMPALAGGS